MIIFKCFGVFASNFTLTVLLALSQKILDLNDLGVVKNHFYSFVGLNDINSSDFPLSYGSRYTT